MGGNYTGSATATLRIAAANVLLKLAVANHTFGDAPFLLAATSSSAGILTYAIVSGPATLQGNAVTLTGAGTVVVQAAQAATATTAAATVQAAFTVDRATPVLTWAVPASIAYGTPLGAAQLNAAATLNGQPVAGTMTYAPAAGTVLDAGTVPLQARFTPADTANLNLAGTAVALMVAPAATSLSLTTSANPADAGSAVTLAATVRAATGPVPSGTVTFAADGAPLGTATLQNGTATLAFTFAAGSHSVTAAYTGSANQGPSSAALQQSVAVPVAFTVAPSTPTAVTVAAGAPSAVSVAVTPSASFQGTVLLTCIDLPAGVTCVLDAPSLLFAAGGSVRTVTARFDLAAASTHALQQAPANRATDRTPIHVACLLGLLCLPVLVSRRTLRPMPRLMTGFWAAIVSVLLCTGTLLTGCATAPAGTANASQTAQPGTYTVHLLAGSGTTVQSTAITLTVR